MIDNARSTFKIDALGKTGILHVIGDVDTRNASLLEAAIARLCAAHSSDVYVAFGECMFVDEAALRVLRRSCASAGGRLRIVAPRGAYLRELARQTAAPPLPMYEGFEEAFLTRGAPVTLPSDRSLPEPVHAG